ncbi:MAG: gamma-glutamyl-gamma-aminobutyrate hydrolase family protein [Acidimicrobiia bacterium]
MAVVGGTLEPGRVRGWRQGALAVPLAYLEAIHRAGGEEAVLLPVDLDEQRVGERLARFDGLLLIGGGDVAPSLYGEKPHPQVFGIEPTRDGFESSVLRAAMARRMPILCVCRGVQVLNVALDGSLVQHLPDLAGELAHRGADGKDGVTHQVEIDPASKLAGVTGSGALDVFSHHHQAIARVGEGLTPVAWAPDGTIEAVEHQSGWVVGVQWHPEATAAEDQRQQSLFDALVERAGRPIITTASP